MNRGPGAVSGTGEPADGLRLALDTATDVGSIALRGNGIDVEIGLRIRGVRSARVLPAIEHALRVNGAAPEQIAEIVIGAGPGSFTGVRIAASMAKGWVAARGVRLFAYPSLMGVAAGIGAAGPVCAMFDARRGEVYAACYDVEETAVHERLPPAVRTVESLVRGLAERDLQPAFAGAGALRYADAIRRAAPGARILPAHLGVPRAASLLWLREIVPDPGRVERPSEWEPLYVREWRVSQNRKESPS